MKTHATAGLIICTLSRHLPASGGSCLTGHEDAALDRAQSMRWVSRGDGPAAQKLLMKLRWCTLGPQFDWTARVYDSERPYKPLPAELHALACRLGTSAAKYLPDKAGMHMHALAHSSPGRSCQGHGPLAACWHFSCDVLLEIISKHRQWLRRFQWCNSKLEPGRGSGQLLP